MRVLHTRGLGEVVTNKRVITSESQLPAPIGGEIFLENGINYDIEIATFFLTNPINISNVTSSSSIVCNSNTIIYTGSGAMFRGTFSGTFVFNQGIIIGDGLSDIWDLTGNLNPAGNILSIRSVLFSNFSNGGKLEDIGSINFSPSFYNQVDGPLVIKSCPIMSLSIVPFTHATGSNSPKIVLDGTFIDVGISNTFINILSGESFLQISPDIVVSGKIIVINNPYNSAAGGEFLASAIIGSVTAVVDNGSGFTRMTMTSHAITGEQKLILSGFATELTYNGTFEILSVVDSNTIDVNIVFVGNDTGSYSTGDSNLFLDDNSFDFRANGDQVETNEVCKYKSLNTIPITITGFSTDGTNAVAIVGNSIDWTSVIDRRFVTQFAGDANGTTRYTGSKVLLFRISSRITADVVGGASKLFKGYVTVNGVVQVDSRFEIDSARPSTWNPEDTFELNPNDIIGLAIENQEDTTNIDILFANTNIIKA